jgi:hypothetical protein
MRHVVVQHHLNDADGLKVLENRGKIAIILAVCPGCSLMKKIKAVDVCPFVFSQSSTISEMTEDTSMSVGSCCTILTENLGMCCASAAKHLHRPTETNWTERKCYEIKYYG